MLAISVDLDHGGALRSPADFQFEFGADSVRVFSLFGETELAYPPGYIIAANQTDARPAWGAWAPDILGLAATMKNAADERSDGTMSSRPLRRGRPVRVILRWSSLGAMRRSAPNSRRAISV